MSTLDESLGKLLMNLDRLLMRFWESHSILPKIRHSGVSQREEKEAIDCVRYLLSDDEERMN